VVELFTLSFSKSNYSTFGC